MGRTSVTAKAIIVETLYASKYGALRDKLRADGFTTDEIVRYAERLRMDVNKFEANPLVNTYEVEYQAGHSIEFTGELRFKGTASGFDLETMFSSLDIRGKPLAELPNDAVLLDSKEFSDLVEKFVMAKDARQAEQAEAKNMVASLLAGETFFGSTPDNVYEKPLRWRDRFKMEVSDGLTWSSVSPDRMEFSVAAQATFLTDYRWINRTRTVGDTAPLRIYGVVRLASAEWVISFKIAIQDGSEFSSNGSTFTSYTVDGQRLYASDPNYGTRLDVRPQPSSSDNDPQDRAPQGDDWRIATISNGRAGKFNLRRDECLELMADSALRGGSLLYYQEGARRSDAVKMPARFVVEGPKRGVAVGFSGSGSITIRIRPYPKVDGTCE